MNILVVGSGGREHCIIKKIKENKNVSAIYAMPGNAGMAEDAVLVPIDIKNIKEITKKALELNIDYAIVAPDDPLVAGCVDELEKAGIKCFGPNKRAAIIEGSKIFSKELMKKYNIPTAGYACFDNSVKAIEYLQNISIPVVIKADGLALGKGVIIAETYDEAVDAIKELLDNKKFGTSSEKIVIEEYLTGPEVSVLSFTDGKTLVPMLSSMDHKRALDGDKGLNTGGMGTVAPNPYYTDEIAAECMKSIFIPTIEAMNKENRTFKGCLYFGLMLTDKGPKVIEYNCRFGDPETQVVLPLLDSDLLEIMMKVTDGNLSQSDVRFADNSACCVIMASSGYPKAYEKGYPIDIDSSVKDNVYIAGAAFHDGQLVTNGGRVLGVTAVDTSLKRAVEQAYIKLKGVSFENSFYRKDIGQKALNACKEDK